MTQTRIKFSRSGFTLVEVLIGLSIFSVVAVSVYAVLVNGLTLNRRTRQMYDLSRDTRWLMEIMAKDVENSVAYQASTDAKANPEEQKGPFVGGPFEMSFFRETEQGLIKVRYFFRPADEGVVRTTTVNRDTSIRPGTVGRSMTARRVGSLIREEVPLMRKKENKPVEPDVNWETDADASAEGEEILSRFVVEDSLRFFYAAWNEGRLVWTPQWHEPKDPAAVRVELTLEHPDDERQVVTFQRDMVVPTGMWGESL